MSKIKIIIFILLSFLFIISYTKAEIVNEIVVKGNKRISKETIQLFSDVETGQDINNDQLNSVTEKLYETNFFKYISTNFKNNILTIFVEENPIIQSIKFSGIKSSSLKEFISKDLFLKDRSSYNEFELEKDKSKIIDALKRRGYYFASVECCRTKGKFN